MDGSNEQQASARPARSGRWHYLLVALLAGTIVFWRLGTEVMDDHECKLALSARTMADPDLWLVEGDDPYAIPEPTPLNRWLVPVENGRPRLVKTPLPYWLAAGLARAVQPWQAGGAGVNEWTARLPAAISAVLCALVTLAIGRRMFSPRSALMGAVMFATCVGFVKWGRNARPEMLLCLLITAAMGCFYLGLESATRRGRTTWMIAFWLVMGLANLAKQFVPLLLAWPLAVYLLWRQDVRDRDDPAALRRLRMFLVAAAGGLGLVLLIENIPALHWWDSVGFLRQGKGMFLTIGAAVGIPLVGYLIATRGWRPIVPLLPTLIPGALVMFAMFLPWMWYMTRLFPGLAGAVFSDQVTARTAGTNLWTVAGPQKYLQGLVTFALPWLVLLPGAFVVGLMRRFRPDRRGLVFLLLWSIGLIGLFTTAAAKREHYILPMIPALCLLMGFVAEDVFFRHRWIRPHHARWLGGAHGAVALAAVVGMGATCYVHPHDPRWVHMLVVTALAAVPMTAAGWLAWRGRFRPVVAMIVLALGIVYVGFYTFAELWDPRRPARDFAAAAARIIPADAPVYHWGDPQAKVPFYLGRYVPAVQWRFQRIRPSTVPVPDRVRAFIEAGNAPWMFGYAMSGDDLGKLGYTFVLGEQGMQRKRLYYTLYHREPEGP